jgi:protein-S-isoprenylcysteine O-methyltransferase Ste14
MTQIQSIDEEASANTILKIIALIYRIVAHTAFFVTILFAIGFVMGVAVPKTIDSGTSKSPSLALIVNLVLLSVFAIQHGVMAPKRFKKWWTQFVPKPTDRSTYVMLASLCLTLQFWQWRPMPAIVWQIDDPNLTVTIAAISLAGCTLVFTSTFLTNHFEFFGLHQVTANLASPELRAAGFRTPPFDKFVRHPIYLGFIVAFWATPEMTVGHLLFASLTTLCIFAGIFLEERDLGELFGDDYRQYRVSMLFP